MRLYNEAEDNIKVVKVENYSVFRNLFKSKYLFYLLIAYTVYVFANAALSFLDGGVAMAIINLLVHGAICASLWLFAKDNRNNNDDKLELKSTKIFQIAHAVKYVVVFILLVLAIILVVFTWLDAANVAKQAVVKAQSSLIEGELIAAKAARNKVFWSSVGTLVFFVAFSIIVLVYYKAVMCVVDCMNKYNEKGTHLTGNIGNNRAAYFRHISRAGVVFLDFHVEARNKSDIPCKVGYPAVDTATLQNTYFNRGEVNPNSATLMGF